MNTLPTDVAHAFQTNEDIVQFLRAVHDTLPHEIPQIWSSARSFNTTNTTFIRISLPLPAETDVAHFFSVFSTPHKIYWKSRNSKEEITGIGIGHRVETTSNNLSSTLRTIHAMTSDAPENVRFFGGTRFHAARKTDTLWHTFPETAFTLPFLECERIQDDVALHCTLAVPDAMPLPQMLREMQQQIRQILNDVVPSETTETLPSSEHSSEYRLHVQQRSNTPPFDAWKGSVDAALSAFAEEDLEKVVLARRVSLQCAETPDAFSLLQERMRHAEHTTAFLFQEHSTTAFFGVTPELLYARTGRSITTEAVAGTRKRGATSQEDNDIANELLHSDKDRREHASVQRFIASALDELTETFTIGTVDVLQLHHLQHLYASFHGHLRATIDDAAILEQLHPTPAVGGTPRREALDFLCLWEDFDRGWYAAPVGWVNAHAAEFVVAIRSALITERSIHLFSGAGVVAGSEAEKEWQEIEMKIAPFLKLFHCD
ncbi:MAG: isochorismate synthase [Candidatus Kapaibacterium sp.]|nr:MAG: isochorismate synthase [Candidatus Kapabacteria bacterium]